MGKSRGARTALRRSVHSTIRRWTAMPTWPFTWACSSTTPSAVQRRIVECTERRNAGLAPRDLPIQHVQEAGEKNDQRSGKKTTYGKESCRDEIHNQPKKCKEIGIYAGGSESANNFVEQPLAAGSDCTCKCSHVSLVVSQNDRIFTKWN